jgi:hypothetical protein
MRYAAAALLLAGACTMTDVPRGADAPRTLAETSSYESTTTSAGVEAFVDACVAAAPRRLVRLSLGRSHEGRDVPLVLAADPVPASVADARRDGRPVVLVMANIHAGEVEGKEAALELLREIAFDGAHGNVLGRAIVAFVPNYNPDGNDAVDRKNRPDQAGPVAGVGRRPNGQGLDLNRDYLKAEAPETAGLLRAVRDLDALLVVDCHATNGSYHGYDLTYAGPLCPATDDAVLRFVRGEFLPAVRAGMAARGFATFDYGNWVDESDPRRGWESFEPRPRFGNSYFGLRNRLTLLSEAYSHDPFRKRIASTKALILEGLAQFVRRADALVALCRDADRRGALGAAATPRLPTKGEPAYVGIEPVPVGSVREETDPQTGLVRQWDTDVATPTPMPVYPHFDGVAHRPVPAVGWAVRRPSANLLRLFDLHGILYRRVSLPERAVARLFVVKERRISSSPFQGARLATFSGRDVVAPTELPPGAVVVPAEQPLLRLVFMLMEPESEDGFGTWGILGTERDLNGLDVFEALRIEAAGG